MSTGISKRNCVADARTSARNYVEDMWSMLQQEKPVFVHASSKTDPVREPVEKAFKHLGYDFRYVRFSISLP